MNSKSNKNMPKKLKIETWLKKLPDGYRELALKNRKSCPCRDRIYAASADRAIADGFWWDDTDEGWTFWEDVRTFLAYKPSVRPKLPKLPKKKK